jgi:suppressor of fused-like protein
VSGAAPGDAPAPGPGAVALDAHLDRAIGPVVRRWRPRDGDRPPEQNPLDQIAGRREGDHWHLATYGLTEIDAKESADPTVSGWGFELGIRVECGTDAERPPDWAADLLTTLAVYVWTSRHPFAAGHHLALGGPIRLDATTELTAAVVVADPVVTPFDSPFGAAELLHLVGVTADELEWCRSWSTEGVVGLLARPDPLLVTRLGRGSVLADPGVRAEAEERARADGASLVELRVGTLEVERHLGRATVVRMGAGTATALGPALRRELVADGASFRVIGDEATVTFAAGGRPGARAGGDGLRIELPLAAVADIAALFDGHTGWGRAPGVRGVRFQVVP